MRAMSAADLSHSVEAEVGRLRALLREHDYTQALSATEALLRTVPENRDVLYLRARAQRLSADTAAALATLIELERLHPRFSRLYEERGLCHVVLKQAPDGLSLNGAPPSADVLSMLQERLGFELPMDDLRFWLLGVPNPDAAFELERNGQDRAQQLVQAGWTLNYDRYVRVNGDLLPSRIVLRRDEVRVRIAVDRWEDLR